MLWGEKRHSFRASQLRSYIIIISTLPVLPLHKIRQPIGPIPRWGQHGPAVFRLGNASNLSSCHPHIPQGVEDVQTMNTGETAIFFLGGTENQWMGDSAAKKNGQVTCFQDVTSMIFTWYFQVNPSNYNPFGAWYFWEHLHRKPPVFFIPSHPSRWSWPPCQPTDTYPRISFDHCRNPRFHYI